LEQTPTSRLLIYGTLFFLLISMAFAFFALTGGILRPVGANASLYEVIYEPVPPEGGGRPAAAKAGEDHMRKPLPAPQSNREPSIPETKAEEQYYSAIQKADDQEQRQAQRIKPREDLLRFLETPLGRDFRAVAELARRGKTKEAREYIQRVLEAMRDADPHLQAYALKLAIHIYKIEKDTNGLASATKRYLELSRDRISSNKETEGEGRDPTRSLMEIEEAIRGLEQGNTGGGR